jgi:outer membrane protein assembly factor BamA
MFRFKAFLPVAYEPLLRPEYNCAVKGTWFSFVCVMALSGVASACQRQGDQKIVTIVRPAQPIVRPAQPAIVEDVRVAGNRRISTETIHSNIESKRGEPFDQIKINGDEDRLRSLGYFDDVRVTIEKGPNGGPIVTFNVREKRP